MTEPTDAELIAELEAAGVSFLAFLGGLSGAKKVWTTSGSQDAEKIAAGMRAAIAKWGTPSAVAQEPCPTCIALARTVMLDQVSFDRKPDCYGIRQITDDEGVEEWEDIRTSPDVAREEANDMMATGRGEIYEVVPLWTTPKPSPAAQGRCR